MNLLELCGVAFLVLIAILIGTAVWLQITGGLDLFDDDKAAREIDRQIRDAEVAGATHSHVRAGVYQQGSKS